MRQIGEILKEIYGEKAPFPILRREKYREYSVDDALAEVEFIGKIKDEAFRIDDYNRDAYTNVIKWIHNDPSMTCMSPDGGNRIAGDLKKGIYIAGGTGTGKSWLFEVMAVYANTLRFRIECGGRTCPLKWQNIRTATVCRRFLSSGDLSMYENVDIIGLQDLGSEPIETLYMGSRVEVMREILESRGDDCTKLTLITSNMKINDGLVLKRYGPRVYSRLNSMCNYIELTGLDRRTGKVCK